MLSKSKQKGIGILLSYLGQLVLICSGLLYTPLMLRLLGQSEYGLYQLVYTIISYLGVFNFGFSSSYIRYYTKAKRSHGDTGVDKVNGLFFIIFMAMALIALICGIILTFNIRVVFGSGLSSIEYSKARVLLMLMTINLAITLINTCQDCQITAREQFVFQRLCVIVSNILNPFICLPLLFLGYGSVSMVCVSLCLTILKLIINVLYCNKKLKIRYNFKSHDRQLFKEIWHFTFFIFLSSIIDQINNSVDKVLLGRIVGTSSVALYGVASTIFVMYNQFSSNVSSVFVPQINKLVASNPNDFEISKLWAKVGRLQYIVVFLVLSGFTLWGKKFIGFWAGDGYEKSYRIALLLMIPIFVALIQSLGVDILRAKNMHKIRSLVYGIITILNIGVSIPCIYLWGAEGAAFGTACTQIVGNWFFINYYYEHKAGLNIRYYWHQISEFLKPSICVIIFGLLLKQLISVTNLLMLTCSISLYTVVYFIIFYTMGMNVDEKCILKKIIGNILQNRLSFRKKS